eukprot:1141147-Pelagomonas_calceolata.AAC.4
MPSLPSAKEQQSTCVFRVPKLAGIQACVTDSFQCAAERCVDGRVDGCDALLTRGQGSKDCVCARGHGAAGHLHKDGVLKCIDN